MATRIRDTSIFQGIVEFSQNGTDYRAELEHVAGLDHVQNIRVFSRTQPGAYTYLTSVVSRGTASRIWKALNRQSA